MGPSRTLEALPLPALGSLPILPSEGFLELLFLHLSWQTFSSKGQETISRLRGPRRKTKLKLVQEAARGEAVCALSPPHRAAVAVEKLREIAQKSGLVHKS